METRGATPPPAWVRLLQPVRLALYTLLAAAAAFTLFGGPLLEQAVREGRLAQPALLVAPGLLLLFIVVFAAYRYALVRTGHYHAGKAFVQVGLMLLILTLLLPRSLERYQAAGIVRPVDLARFLGAPDPEARAMAAELARHRERGEALQYVPRLVELVEDASPEVRRQARATLQYLAGSDAGGDGPDAPARWRDYWRGQGTGATR
jgi:hypothetical protein